ncbi:MAG: efflux system, outer rane lipoprotein NodT family [Verrucomicrobia bacterium]|nr:efflux system, outer rane lipoprotein NodT family [Verrucomicrobiota bacterium]
MSASPAAWSVNWWRSFQDPALDELESRALAANQDLRAALARIDEARALAGVARSNYLPSLALEPSVTRQRDSRTVDNALPVTPATTYQVPLSLSWEIDLSGRVRRLTESARADMSAAASAYAATQLSLTAEVAATYFTLRALQQEFGLVTRTRGLRTDALKLVQSRYKEGSAGELDVARADTELATTDAEASALGVLLSSTQNALATLLGEPASSFELPALPALPDVVPVIPAGLPSELLTRRPDILAAEQRLVAANARIGLAKSAFFPALFLTGSSGYASADIDNLFHGSSRMWSIGPAVYLPLFQGGRNRANLARSQASYEETLATYRRDVLVAFREVQDALTASRLLGDQAAAQARAVVSARRGAELSAKRYSAGYVSYFEVVDAERTALEVERAEVRLAGQRWLTHIALIKALGGGWSGG